MLVVDVPMATYIIKLWSENPLRPRRSFTAVRKWCHPYPENDAPLTPDELKHLIKIVQQHSVLAGPHTPAMQQNAEIQREPVVHSCNSGALPCAGHEAICPFLPITAL